MNVLILGKDQRLFADKPVAFGDTRARHLAYAQALDRLAPGSSVRVVSRGVPGLSPDGIQLGANIRCIGTRSHPRWRFFFDLPEAIGRAMADGWRPNVVTTQEPWEDGTYGLWLARKLGAHFLAQFHFDPFAPAWRSEHWLNPLKYRFAMAAARRADGIRVVARATRERFLQLGFAPEKVSVVPVGIAYQPTAQGDRAEWKRQLFPQWADKTLVLFVGGFFPPKDLTTWVRAAARLAAARNDVVFAMVGDGPLLNAVRRQAGAAGLADRVAFPGAIAFDALPPYYAAADLFMLSSSYEAWGRVIVEAQLSGCPVVCTRASGPLDLIRDGETGLLAPIGDDTALADRVSSLIDDLPLREKLSRTAQVEAQRLFSMERLADGVARFWLNLPAGG